MSGTPSSPGRQQQNKPLADDTPTAVGNRRYMLAEMIADSGMSLVWTAWDRVANCYVVVKCPHADYEYQADADEQFCVEVRTQMNVRHPHVVTVLDLVWHHSRPYAIFQYCGGGSLKQRVHHKRLHSMLTMPTWLPSIADALDHLHQQGIVHRDVKPDNFFFDDDEKVYLGDFGIVQRADGLSPWATQEESNDRPSADQDPHKRSSQASLWSMGTVPYMAPEISDEGQAFAQTDQFALAVSLYEILLGRRPFDGETLVAVYLNQVSDPITLEKLAQDCPQLPGSAAQALVKALSFDRHQRFESCTAFIEAFLADVEREDLVSLADLSTTNDTKKQSLVDAKSDTTANPRLQHPSSRQNHSPTTSSAASTCASSDQAPPQTLNNHAEASPKTTPGTSRASFSPKRVLRQLLDLARGQLDTPETAQ